MRPLERRITGSVSFLHRRQARRRGSGSRPRHALGRAPRRTHAPLLRWPARYDRPRGDERRRILDARRVSCASHRDASRCRLSLEKSTFRAAVNGPGRARHRWGVWATALEGGSWASPILAPEPPEQPLAKACAPFRRVAQGMLRPARARPAPARGDRSASRSRNRAHRRLGSRASRLGGACCGRSSSLGAAGGRTTVTLGSRPNARRPRMRREGSCGSTRYSSLHASASIP